MRARVGNKEDQIEKENWNSAKIKQLQNNNLTYQLYQFEMNNPDGVDYNNLTMVFVVMVVCSLAAGCIGCVYNK